MFCGLNFNIMLHSMLSGVRHLTRVSRLVTAQSCVRMSSSSARAQFVFPDDQPLTRLDASTAWTHLTPSEQLYSHYLSKASWWGGLVVLLQTSPESPDIFR